MRSRIGFALLTAAVTLAAACTSGSSGSDDDGDDDDDGSSAPTYWADVYPILDANCVGCHVAGGIGPFSLEGYANAQASAAVIETVTETRYMPPSNVDNSGACNTWTDARWLSDADIATIGEWVAGGTLEGNPADAPTPVPTPTAVLAEIDATLDMGVDYTPTLAPDEYRCFLVDPALATDQYLTAYRTVPGNDAIVHHVVLFSLADAQAQTDAEDLDAASAEPGYTCFGGAQVSSSIVTVWAPGTGVTFFPPGTGILLPAGRKLVLQVHYNTAAVAGSDRTEVELDLEPVVTSPAQILALGVGSFTIPPGEDSYDVVMPTVTSPATATIHSVYPHMHRRGETIRVNLDGACMLDVPRWNFGWQQFFTASTPITVPNGGTFDLTCTYDTQSDTNPISSGEGTDEEMCGVGLYVTAP